MTRNMDLLGIPSLPMRAFVDDGSGRIKPQGKGGGSAPKTPDYTAAAEATSQGNLDLAKYTTEANRINQYTPWGSMTYTNDRTFDQNAYDAAMSAYNRQASQPQQPQYNVPYPQQMFMAEMGQYLNPRQFAQQQPQIAPPSADDFWSGGDNWSQHVQLAPELQAQLEQQWAVQAGLFGPQNAALGRVQQMMGSDFNPNLSSGGTALNPNSLPGMGTAFSPTGEQLATYDPNLQTNDATNLLMERINPQLDRQRESLRAQLANQGIAQGSSAYNSAMEQHGQSANDAYTQASLAGIGLGMQQQGMQFDQGLQNRGLLAGEQAQQFNQQQGLRMGEAGLQGQQFGQAEQVRQRELAEQSYLRNLPMQELQMLMGGGQVQMPQFPGYAQQAQTAGPDLLGAANQQYQGQLGAYNAQQAGQSNMMGGLFGLGGALLGAPSSSILGGLFGL